MIEHWLMVGAYLYGSINGGNFSRLLMIPKGIVLREGSSVPLDGSTYKLGQPLGRL